MSRVRVPSPSPLKEQKLLNRYQEEAVRKSVESKDIFLIHGPPGTGKTTTLVASIEEHVRRGYKVLATADSNLAVDNLMERLLEKGIRTVRIGNPIRVLESLKERTLETLIEKHKEFERVREIYEKIEKLKGERDRYRRPEPKYRRGLSDEEILKHARTGTYVRGLHPKLLRSMARWISINSQIKKLYEEAVELERKIAKEIISEAEVVCATNSSAGSEVLEGEKFDVVFIDEATQSTEPSCLIPFIKGEKIIMAGDHKQLPPTVLSYEAWEALSYSMFERFMDLYGKEKSFMLRVQYRMNEKIMDFPNRKFYNGLLIADESVRNHTLKDLGFEAEKFHGKMKDILEPENVVVFVNSEGKEEKERGEFSYRNQGEALKVKEIFEALMEGGLKEEHVGIISPYEAQVELLKSVINNEKVEIKTVDGFQGREKEVIIISFVRSNDKGDIGFLKDYRRLNVAITRPKRKLIMVGNAKTLSRDEIYRELIEHSIFID